MIVKVNKEIRERGLCRKLVEIGFGDLEVRLGSVVLKSIKSILVNGNETLKNILLDDHFVGYLELYSGCSEIGYYEIEKYYSGGELLISKDNVCDILKFCLCYRDEEIISDCFNYLKNNIDDEILMKLIEISNHFPNSLRDIDTEKNLEFEKRSNKYLYSNEYLMRLELNNVKMLLSFGNIIIRSECCLLNRLLEWCKYKQNNGENDEYDNVEFVNEFKELIENNIDGKKLKEAEMKEETKEILNEMKVELRENQDIKHIDLNEISDENIQDIIINKCIHDEEEELKEEEKVVIDKMKEEEICRLMMLLLRKNNVKIIEIVIMIIMYKRIRIEDVICKIEERDIIMKLCNEYNQSKRNRSLKCLSIFIVDKKIISIIENLCGKEILFKLLNEESIMNDKMKKLIIEYIKESRLSLEEEEEMRRIIKDEESIEKLKTKEITSLSYPQSEYLFTTYDEISIIPSFDGTRCEFSISPPLPLGITINKENGIINGKAENETKKKEYEICCKNVRNEKKFKMSLKFIDVKFTELNKSNGILISNNGKLMTCQTDHFWCHCYLNLKMENGIYHIKYKFHFNGGEHSEFYDTMLGLSTDNSYSNKINNLSTTCNYVVIDGFNYVINDYCHIGKVVNSKPDFNFHKDGSIYEVTVDMNYGEFWISVNNLDPVLLVEDLPSPLYPYALLKYQHCSFELLSVSHQD